MGHFVTPPNGWNDANSEGLILRLDADSYANWKAEMMRKNIEMVKCSDATVLLNCHLDNGESYVGGSSFLEAYEAFKQGKKLFLLNPVSTGVFKDELTGFAPVVVNGDLSLIA